MIKTFEYMPAFRGIEPGFRTGVLFERMEFSNVNITTTLLYAGSFPENMMEVLYMFQYQTKRYEVIRLLRECPIRCDVSLLKLNIGCCDLLFCFGKHFFGQINGCNLLCLLNKPLCILDRATANFEHPTKG